jgi:hypothetical protein
MPDGLLLSFPKRGHALERDHKWTGSHRYGIVHLGAADRDALRARAETASALLGWPAPYLDAIESPHATDVADRSRTPAAATRPAPSLDEWSPSP